MIRIFQALFAIGFVMALGLFALLALAPPGTDLSVFANNPDDKFGHFLAFFVLGPLAAGEMLKEPTTVKRARFVEILDTISQTSLCGFGRDFPRPLRQLIDQFGVERVLAKPEP